MSGALCIWPASAPGPSAPPPLRPYARADAYRGLPASCFALPWRAAEALARRYEAFLGAHELLVMDDAVINAAPRWRVSGLKTPDALHVALAKQHECTAFWTNDDRLAKAAPGWTENALKDVES